MNPASETSLPDEEYQVSRGNRAIKRRAAGVRTFLIALGAIMLCLAGFFIGAHSQESHDKSISMTTANGQAASSGDGAGQHRGGFGQVTAASLSSVTIQNQRSGQHKTYSITGSTSITDEGRPTKADDIKTGDMVIIEATVTNHATARRIMVNPNFDDPEEAGQTNSKPAPRSN